MITFYKSVGNTTTTTTNKKIKTTKSKNQLSPVHSKLMLPWKLSLAKWVDEPSPSSLLILEYLAKYSVPVSNSQNCLFIDLSKTKQKHLLLISP